MTTLYRSRVVLTGWEGAPGLNTIIWSKGTLISVGSEEVEQWHDDLGAAFAAQKGACVDNWRFTIQASVDVFDSVTGNLTGVITSAGGDVTDVNGTAGSSKLSRATQAIISAQTDVFEGGRRLQGRLFFGPLNSDAFDEDGTIQSGVIDGLNTAFGALNTGTGPRWGIWSRPKPGGGGGYYGDIVTVNTREKPGVLRSRRD